MTSTLPPVLEFVAGSGGSLTADLDALLGSGIFIEGVTRSGKTNLIRVLLEQTYGMVQHIVLDPEGEYRTLRSEERPYLIVGRDCDVDLPPVAAAVEQFTLAIVEKGVSMIVDLSEYDEEDQQVIVSSICNALVSLPQSHPGNAIVVIEELQEFAAQGGGRDTALRPIRRLAKRGLKRGFTIVGGSQRVSDVSKGVVTMLKSKAIGGTDMDDVKRALTALGMPMSQRAAVADLQKGQFWVKGPAFARHAQLVAVPLAQTTPPARKRGEPPTPAPEAPAQIAALAAVLREQVAKEEAARLAAEESERPSYVNLGDVQSAVADAVRIARAPFLSERASVLDAVSSSMTRLERAHVALIQVTTDVAAMIAHLDGVKATLSDSLDEAA